MSDWKLMDLPDRMNQADFQTVLDNYLFLKSPKTLQKLDEKFTQIKSRELAPS